LLTHPRAEQNIHEWQHIFEHTVPLIFRIVVGVQGGGQSAPLHLSEEFRELRRELAMQKERGQMKCFAVAR